MGRAKKRADRIRATIPIDQILSDLGYEVRSYGGDREQQFSCDLHGDGSDTKPSARMYPSSNSWYCFACAKKRDAISTYMDREGIPFSKACTEIEKKYGLEPLPFEKNENGFQEFQVVKATYPEMRSRVEKLISNQRVEKNLTLKRYLSLWEVFDMISYQVEKGNWNEDTGYQGLVKLKRKTLEYIKERIKSDWT